MVAHGCLFRQLEDPSQGPPKYGINVTADGHRLNIFHPDFRRGTQRELAAMAAATAFSGSLACTPKSFLRLSVRE